MHRLIQNNGSTIGRKSFMGLKQSERKANHPPLSLGEGKSYV
jgi:hypothetical protein